MNKKMLCLGICIALTMAVCGCGESTKMAKGAAESTTEEATEQSTEESGEETTTEESKNTLIPEVTTEETTEAEITNTGNVVVDIPEGFREYLAPSGIYVTEKYPDNGTNIYIVTAPFYGELPDEKGYIEKINENISSQVGEVVKINLVEFGKITIDGCDAIRAIYTYSHGGMNFKRLEYTINTDITTIIAYTQEGDSDWMETFEESALTIRVE